MRIFGDILMIFKEILRFFGDFEGKICRFPRNLKEFWGNFEDFCEILKIFDEF